MLHSNLSINEQNHLVFAGVDTVEMAHKYGTPLYLMDEDRIRSHCRTYKSLINKYLGPQSNMLYASKACSFKQMYRIANEENIFVDVVSGGELYTAIEAGFQAENIFFHGNNKTPDEIRFAIEHGLGYFIVDNPDELERINEEAGKQNVKQKILLRMTPGVDAHTNKKISTGLVEAKFGSVIETGDGEAICKMALSMENIDLKGFHSHIGSQLFDSQAFIVTADIMIAFAKSIYNRYGYTAEILNLGGGFGVRYTEEDPVLDVDKILRQLSDELASICGILKYPCPAILLEPGRGLVGDAGITLYTVGGIKMIEGHKNYVAIDGGMTDNPRYTLYEAKHSFLLANRAGDVPDFKADIAGHCCESGDLLMEDALIPKPEKNDILCTLVTGAYNYSMASNYNRFTRPPVVMVSDGKDYIAVKRESYEDLCRNDV